MAETVEQLKLDLNGYEYAGLVRAAEADLRNITAEARHLLREALERRGLYGPELPVGDREA
jgi:hypothetical protein